MWWVIGSVAVVAVCVAGLAGSTASGAHRRGNGWPLAALAGLVFPLTWVLWYAVDERLDHHAR